MAGAVAHRELTALAPRDAAVTIALADRRDDADLRRLLREAVMPGAVSVALTREPDYFAAEGLAGADDFTVVARGSGSLLGAGRCSVHQLNRNGGMQRVGYLSELRLNPASSRSVKVIREGYALLRSTTVAARVDRYFTSIAADNVRARRVLEHGARLGLPVYAPLTELVTLVAPVARAQFVESDDVPRAELISFLREHARDAHLTLAWSDAQWESLASHGLSPQNFSVIRRGGRIVAAAALWDQRRFRQTVIAGYSGALRVARPWVNALNALRRRPSLPPAGSVLAHMPVFGATVADVAAWPELWRALCANAARMGVEWLTLARDVRDPELPVLRRTLAAREYRTRLYEVRWPDQPASTDAWDARPFRPEVALL